MAEKENIKKPQQEQEFETLVRIMGYDIPGSRGVYVGLTYIKGISWAISNLACIKLEIPRSKKIAELTKDEIKEIENFMKNLPAPDYMKNNRFDIDSGETKHYFGTDLEMKREFDVKRLIKMKSYKGRRHASGLPVRGQRTRANFRTKTNRRTTGMKQAKPAEKK